MDGSRYSHRARVESRVMVLLNDGEVWDRWTTRAMLATRNWRQPTRQAWSTGAAGVALFCITLMILLGLVGGCRSPEPELNQILPNTDPALRKSKKEFAADAQTRQPFKDSLPAGGKAKGAASVDYGADIIQIANFTDQDWTDVEIWVNRQYVVYVTKIEKSAGRVKTINFYMLYNAQNAAFPVDNKTVENQVKSIDLVMGGKVYELPVRPAE